MDLFGFSEVSCLRLLGLWPISRPTSKLACLGLTETPLPAVDCQSFGTFTFGLQKQRIHVTAYHVRISTIFQDLVTRSWTVQLSGAYPEISIRGREGVGSRPLHSHPFPLEVVPLNPANDFPQSQLTNFQTITISIRPLLSLGGGVGGTPPPLNTPLIMVHRTTVIQATVSNDKHSIKLMQLTESLACYELATRTQ